MTRAKPPRRPGVDGWLASPAGDPPQQHQPADHVRQLSASHKDIDRGLRRVLGSVAPSATRRRPHHRDHPL